MRELKFRFWNTIARRFQPSKRYAIDGNGKLLGYDFELAQYDDDPVPFTQTCIIPQQYTGLQDSNGKDIYEGDIVRYILGDRVYVEQIAWEHFCWVFLSFDGGSSSPIVSLPSLEVIGNITENPELKTP